MRTTNNKITKRIVGKLPCILVASIVFLLKYSTTAQAVTVVVDGNLPTPTPAPTAAPTPVPTIAPTPPPTPAPPPFSYEDYATSICRTPNCVSVGAALDSARGDSRASALIGALSNEPIARLCQDLNLIAPEELTSMFDSGISMTNLQTSNLERRMDRVRAGVGGFSASIMGSEINTGLAGPTGPDGKNGPPATTKADLRWGFFVSGFGEWTNVDDTNNAAGYDLSTGGVTLGIDYRLTPNFAIGIMGGYASTTADLTNNGNMDMDGGKIGLYATAFGGGFYVNGAATFGFNSYDTQRTGFGGTAAGSTDGRDFTGLIAMGYDWKKGGLSIGPTASFQYTYVEFDGFTEQGSLAPLIYGDQDINSSRTALGIKISYDCPAGSALIRPEIRAAWQHEFGDSEYSITSSFANGAGNAFTVSGPGIGRDSALVGAGLSIIFNDRFSIYAYYDGEFARTNYLSQTVTGGLRVSF